MNQHRNNPLDGRNNFKQFIEMLSPMLTPQQETFLRSFSANSYSSDFNTLMNVLKGEKGTSAITSNTIDSASEYYKQVNKALLGFRYLNEAEKLRESKEIDDEAIILKDNWLNKLKQMRITII